MSGIILWSSAIEFFLNRQYDFSSSRNIKSKFSVIVSKGKTNHIHMIKIFNLLFLKEEKLYLDQNRFYSR